MADEATIQKIYDLAKIAQDEHQALIEQANERRTSADRREIINALDVVRRGFRNQAVTLLGYAYPMQLDSNQVPDDRVVAVHDDIESTQLQLRGLAENATLAKTIKSVQVDFKTGLPKLPKLPDIKIPIWVWAVLILILLLAIVPRRR